MVLDRMGYQLVEVDRPSLEDHLSAGEPGGVEEVADEPRQLRHLAGRDAEGTVVHVASRLGALQHVEAVGDRRQGVAQLVRQHGEVLVLAAVELEELVVSLAERLDGEPVVRHVHVDAENA